MGNKHDFQNSFTHHNETAKTSQTCLQATFGASAVKLKTISHILVMSAAIGLLHRSCMEECCHRKETTSMCLEEKSEVEEGVYSTKWAAVVCRHELQYPLVR